MAASIEQEAVYYWQDSLAKFFPTSKGPTATEVDMFRAGWKSAMRKVKDLKSDDWAPVLDLIDEAGIE